MRCGRVVPDSAPTNPFVYGHVGREKFVSVPESGRFCHLDTSKLQATYSLDPPPSSTLCCLLFAILCFCDRFALAFTSLLESQDVKGYFGATRGSKLQPYSQHGGIWAQRIAPVCEDIRQTILPGIRPVRVDAFLFAGRLTATIRHCATHQIRILLVSCVVITSLFYPALALYSSSHPELLSILDVTRSQYPQDLVNLWAGHDSLRVLEDAVSLAKTHASCVVDRALRVERIFIQSPFDGAVNHQILQSTLAFERRIDDLQLPCLKRPDGKCFVLSPLAFWRHSQAALLEDPNILDTLLSRNVSVAGIRLAPQMVLAGRGSDEPHVTGTNFDFAMFLALTYFFPNSDCLGNAEHLAWLQAVDLASQGAPRIVQKQAPALIALEVRSPLSLRTLYNYS
jgi:hypothetical protein